MRSYYLLSIAVLLGACKEAPPEEETPIVEGGPCDPAGGHMCTYLGIPGMASYAAEDLDRLETMTYLPVDGTYGPDGTFYYIDFNNHRIRAVGGDDKVHTIAGSGFLGDGPEGTALAFAFNHPTDLAFDPNDDSTLYVAAWHNSRINAVHLDTGMVNFECGTGARDFGGDAADAHLAFLDLPSSLAFDDSGTMYIMDQANQLIRSVDGAGVITTVAGKVETKEWNHDGKAETPEVPDTRGWPGYAGDGGPALEARFWASIGQAADPSSRIALHDGYLYIVDTSNALIRRIDTATWMIELVAGKVQVGPAPTPIIKDEVNLGKGFADGAAIGAQFNGPRDLEVASDGTIYVADTENHCVRKIDTAGMVSTIAGICTEPGSDADGGLATASHLWRPYGIEISPDESELIIADTQNQVFRVIGL